MSRSLSHPLTICNQEPTKDKKYFPSPLFVPHPQCRIDEAVLKMVQYSTHLPREQSPHSAI